MDLEQEEVILMKLQAENIFFSYGSKKILENCSLTLTPGKLTVITGPNGSGKSTFVHLLGGLLQPGAGEVLLDGKNLKSFSHIERACRIGVLAQEKLPALDFSVAERIMMGRFAHLPRLFEPGPEDKKSVEEVMDYMGISSFGCTPCNQLSGGEYQKVLIAALLARKTSVMLLDEPTAALDPAGALRCMEIFRLLKDETAIALVTHDLTLAAAFADELILVNKGRIFAAGTPGDVLTKENIAAVYGCNAEILPSSTGPVAVFR